MSDTSDLQTAEARVDTLKSKTVDLSNAANVFARTMTQAFASSSTSGQKFDDMLKSVTLKLAGLAAKSLGSLFSGTGTSAASLGGSAIPHVTPFASGGVIAAPGYFPMAGGVGLAGEAGPEAIMPLQRGADGSLGVAAQGGGNTINVHIATPDADSFRRSESYVTGQIARAVSRGQRSL